MDICTKVTLRQHLLKSGKITLYFDYYLPIRNPKTNRMQRHEYLGIYLYGNPVNKVQRDFNQSMLEKGELLSRRRQELVINRQFCFIDHSQQKEDFLVYYEETTRKKSNTKWHISYKHFHVFTGGKCTFGDITVDFCNRFRDYLLSANQLKHTKKKLTRNAAAEYFSTFRPLLKKAYKEILLTENINDYLDYIEWEEAHRNFTNRTFPVLTFDSNCKRLIECGIIRDNKFIFVIEHLVIICSPVIYLIDIPSLAVQRDSLDWRPVGNHAFNQHGITGKSFYTFSIYEIARSNIVIVIATS